MKVAKILKIVVIVEWVIGFILGILAGSNGGLIYSYYSDFGERTFNFWGAISTWLVFFIMGIFQYGFAEILENVAAMRKKTEEQLFYLNDAVYRLGRPPVEDPSEPVK